MNKLGEPTLKKFKNYLKLKNYSDRTIECYSWAVMKFLESQTKSALHICCYAFVADLINKKWIQKKKHIAKGILPIMMDID